MRFSSHLRMSLGRCESPQGPIEGSLQSFAATFFYFSQILSEHLIVFHECSSFKHFSVDLLGLFLHYFFARYIFSWHFNIRPSPEYY